MARRNIPRGKARTDSRSNRPLSLGSHWRSDGAPKTAYASEADAWTAADVRRQDSGVRLNVYRCDVCPAWHMGKGDGRE